MYKIRTSIDNLEVAKKIGRILLQEKAVVSTHIRSIYTIYAWEGSPVEHVEYELESLTNDFEYAECIIAALHTYQLPEILITDEATEQKLDEWCNRECDLTDMVKEQRKEYYRNLKAKNDTSKVEFICRVKSTDSIRDLCYIVTDHMLCYVLHPNQLTQVSFTQTGITVTHKNTVSIRANSGVKDISISLAEALELDMTDPQETRAIVESYAGRINTTTVKLNEDIIREFETWQRQYTYRESIPVVNQPAEVETESGLSFGSEFLFDISDIPNPTNKN